MCSQKKIAIIGLDTSHTIEFTRRLQSPDCPEGQRVEGLKVVRCMRFPTPFQNEEGLDKRQKQLEDWGVKVSTDFDETVTGCDSVMIEINDPSRHLEYIKKCSVLGKQIFLDKPLADNFENGKKICEIIKKKNLRIFSSSSLRFVPELKEACNAITSPMYVYVYGTLGKAPSGSSIVWYGVHTFEMLQRTMGPGAIGVFTEKDSAGVVCVVRYPGNRRGIVELTNDVYLYGGCLRNKEKSVPFTVNMENAYSGELREIAGFFNGGNPPVKIEDTLEIMAMLDAADCSLKSGRNEKVKL